MRRGAGECLAQDHRTCLRQSWEVLNAHTTGGCTLWSMLDIQPDARPPPLPSPWFCFQLCCVLHKVSYPRGDHIWRPITELVCLMGKTRLAGTQISRLLSLQSAVWALPSFHWKWGPWGWNQAVRTMTYLLWIHFFSREGKCKVCIQTQSHTRRTLRSQALKSSDVGELPDHLLCICMKVEC